MARPTKAERAQIVERRTKAITMRAAGAQWDTIAEKLGYSSRGAACQDVARALEQRLAEQHDQLDHLRAIELEHLETLRRAMNEIVTAGDGEERMKATDRLIKIQERISRLQGIDAPVKVDQGGTVRYEITGVPADAHH
jgi:hypothetical protein